MSESRRILVYGDVNLNIIDGSAIWLTSISEVLLGTGAEVHILLKTSVKDNASLAKLDRHGKFVVHGPTTEFGADDNVTLSPRSASLRMLDLDNKFQYDAIIARGMKVCKFIASSEDLHKKSWLYITDLPFPLERVGPASLNDLEIICDKAFRVLSQTEESRSYLEALCPVAAGKTLIMSPMIPDQYYEEYSKVNNSTTLSLVYAGKFAEDWKTYEMLQLPSEFSARGLELSLTMVGNKFQQSRQDPGWHLKMKDALASSDVNWVGGLSRDQTMQEIRKADLGVGWRSSALDSSMEISTKALEYAASGVPPLINRTQSHEDIFGSDYPFFVDDSAESMHKTILESGHLAGSYRNHVRNAVMAYSMRSAVERFNGYFDRIIPRPANYIHGAKVTKILIAGHDLKFCGELIEYLSALPNVEVLVDKWTNLHTNVESQSLSLLALADIVICEWAGPNAVWYSNNLGADQKLFIRLHAFELRGPWIDKINFTNVDQLFCVSNLYADLTTQATGWPREKISVIPNLIDVQDLKRPKISSSEFNLGLVGMVPFIKRPDRALDLLESLLQVDERYTLHIRGRMPWEYPYEWNKGLQRFAYEEFFDRISSNELLFRSVVFEDFGSDIASWYRKIGIVLSPSTRESFHLAPVEGMAGGAVPVVWDRPGAKEIFSHDFVFSDLSEITDFVLSLREPGILINESNRAEARVINFDVPAVMSLWHEVLFAK